MQELRDLKQFMAPKWIVVGDFSLICRTDDKSNANVNLRIMGRFRAAIDHLELREINLVGRRYT